MSFKTQVADTLDSPPSAPEPSTGAQTIAVLPPLYPEWLGDRSFCEVHGIRFPYVSGAMANGIATTELVVKMAKAGMLGFFGAAGLTPARVSAALDELESTLDPLGLPWGTNLIHSPAEPGLEQSVVELYLSRNVRRGLSLGVYEPDASYYALKLRLASASMLPGKYNVVTTSLPRSRAPEVARHFMSPAPKNILDGLVAQGHLTAHEAQLASQIPVAEDIIVESDSGGHTDNKTLNALFPVIVALRDDLCHQYHYARPIRCGAAGGLGSPSAVAAAFSLGAAFVLTGSVNQKAVESGLSPGRRHAGTSHHL